MAGNNRKNRTTRNAESTLYKRLTKLFSGPIVNYKKQTPRRYKRRELDKFKFGSASGQTFKKTAYDPFENLTAMIMSNQNRVERYADFDQMEYTPEIASALDIYADEMTTSSILQPLLKVDCPNEEIKYILKSLYHNILNIESNLFGWCRTMCKFGDFFLYLDIDETQGIKAAIGLPSQEIERLEGEDKTNPNYVQYQWNSGQLTFENWQIAHFRVLGNDKYTPYGTSVLEPARRIWRQLTLLEDAMMAYRIVRAPERRVFYIDVGNINPNDVEQYMQKVMTQMKRNQVVDSSTGRVDLRYNPLSIEEDYFIPVRGGTSSRIETVPAGQYTGDIDDVKYLRDKLFSALKIPMSYLSRGEGSEEDKTTLAQKDIRFARTIQRLQRVIVSELEKIGIVHLFTMGYRGEDLVSFRLSLNNPSKIAELQELEHWRTKFDTASAATEGFFSKRWVADKVFGLSFEEFLRNQREMFHDRKFEISLEGVGEETGLGAEGAGDAGGLAGLEDLGAEETLGEEPGEEEGEFPPEEPEAETPEAALGGEEETAFLTPPGKRDDDWYKIKKKDAFGRTKKTTTRKSKGKWFEPVTTDKRDMGARKRSYLSQGGKKEKGRRANFPGIVDLDSLAKGIYEADDTNYNIEEQKLLEANEVSSDLKRLIKELELKHDEDKTQQKA